VVQSASLQASRARTSRGSADTISTPRNAVKGAAAATCAVSSGSAGSTAGRLSLATARNTWTQRARANAKRSSEPSLACGDGEATTARAERNRCRDPHREAGTHGGYPAAVSEAAPTPAIERTWWLRAPAVLVAPRAVFVSLRDESQEATEERQEPITAIVGLAGIAGVLGTHVARQLLNDASMSTSLVPVWAFLGGVFYSAALLPQPFQTLIHFNPIYYMISLVRYGFVGFTEVSVALSLLALLAATGALFAVNLRLFSQGYKLRA